MLKQQEIIDLTEVYMSECVKQDDTFLVSYSLYSTKYDEVSKKICAALHQENIEIDNDTKIICETKNEIMRFFNEKDSEKSLMKIITTNIRHVSQKSKFLYLLECINQIIELQLVKEYKKHIPSFEDFINSYYDILLSLINKFNLNEYKSDLINSTQDMHMAYYKLQMRKYSPITCPEYWNQQLENIDSNCSKPKLISEILKKYAQTNLKNKDMSLFDLSFVISYEKGKDNYNKYISSSNLVKTIRKMN